MPKIVERFKDILRLGKGKELLFWNLHMIMEIFVSRLIITSETSP